MMKKENEKSEDFNEIMELKEELDTDIKNLEKDLNYYREHKAEMKENGELDEETEKTFEMLEEQLSSIKSIVSMGNEIMKTTEIIEEYDEDEYLENPELLVKMISEVLRNNELVKEIYLKYNPEETEFFEEFENILDI
jgi:hypothetical protein